MIQTKQLWNTSLHQFCLSQLVWFYLIVKELWWLSIFAEAQCQHQKSELPQSHIQMHLVCGTRDLKSYFEPKVLRIVGGPEEIVTEHLLDISLAYDWTVTKSQDHLSAHTDVLFLILRTTYCRHQISFCQYNYYVTKASHYVNLKVMYLVFVLFITLKVFAIRATGFNYICSCIMFLTAILKIYEVWF